MALSEVPCTCPFAPIFRGDPHPLMARTTQAMALLEEGASERTAWPGGVTAADRAALLILRAAKSRRLASDDAENERQRRADAAKRAAK